MPYKFNPFTGKLDNAPGAPVFPDNKFTVFDDGDKTKRFQFEASGISPSTTRTLDIQDVDGPVAIGHGLANQYIRGDATLANFPVAAGGGSSVSYYFNGSVSQGTILGNPYYEINKIPAGAVQTNFTINAGNTTAYFITDASDPNLLLIPQGNFTFQLYALTSSGNPKVAVELYKYDGATFTQIGATSPTVTISNTASDIHFLTVFVPAATTLALTDRLAVRVIGSSLGGHTITLNTEGNTQSQIITTFSTGLAALNGLTDQVQFLATGTTGADFNIGSTAATHTFNIPTASAANRGALSTADWTAFNGKIGAGLYTATTGLTMNTARLLGRTTAGTGAAEEITVGTGLSLTGTTLTNTASGGSKTYAVFNAMDNQPPATAFATLDTRNSIAILDFDDATDENAIFLSVIPEAAILGSGLKIRLIWTATTATSGDCVWDAALERMNTDIDSDSFDTAASVTTTTSGTSGVPNYSEITLTTIDSVVAGDGFRLKITRDANNGSDTMTGDAELIAVEVRSAA